MDEAAALRDALDRQLADATSETAWPILTRSGACALLVPETSGGLGLGPAAAVPVIGALAERGLSTPFLETAVVAVQLLLAAGTVAGEAVLAGIAEGAVVAVAGLDARLRGGVRASGHADGWRLDGDARLVLDGAVAKHLLIVARTDDDATAVFLARCDDAGISARTYPTIDGRSAADLRLTGVAADLLIADAEATLDAANDVALACLAVEAAGLMRRLVVDTADYTRQREQFGQPIAGFQAIQHRLVDMHIQARRAQAIALRAVAALDAPPGERARLASAAKVTVADAGRFVGQNAVQLHGGMGMTEALPIGRFFKRLTVIEHELGTADQHRARFARSVAEAA